MRSRLAAMLMTVPALVTLLAMTLPGSLWNGLNAKEKTPPIGPDDPTYRLYQVLDTTRGGSLPALYILADTYKDPQADQEYQHVLKVEYDKSRAFGKLRIHVRSVAKLTPDQLKTYTPEQIYDFGETDSLKFTKTDPGPLGRVGDLYFRAEGSRPLTTEPITDEVRKMYDLFLTQYILPAAEKK